MSKKDILNRLKIKHPQINVDQIGKIYEKFIELISQALLDRKRIEIRSLGIFYSKTIKEKKNARNPKTGDEAPIAPRRVLTFRPSHLLKDRVATGNS